MYHIKTFDEIQRQRQGIEDPKPQSQPVINVPNNSTSASPVKADPNEPLYGQRKPDERMNIIMMFSKDDVDYEFEYRYDANCCQYRNFSDLTLAEFKKLCNREIRFARNEGEDITPSDAVKQFAFGSYGDVDDVSFVDDEPTIVIYALQEIFSNYTYFMMEGVVELGDDLDNLTIEQLYNKFSELDDFLKHFEYEELDYGGKFNYETDMEDEFLAWYRDPNRDKLPVPVEN